MREVVGSNPSQGKLRTYNLSLPKQWLGINRIRQGLVSSVLEILKGKSGHGGVAWSLQRLNQGLGTWSPVDEADALTIHRSRLDLVLLLT